MLEGDGHSGHGSGKSNIVRNWKDEHNLKYYFSCAHSPEERHWDDETTIVAIKQEWENLTPEKINEWILSIPKRIDVLEIQGKMTG